MQHREPNIKMYLISCIIKVFFYLVCQLFVHNIKDVYLQKDDAQDGIVDVVFNGGGV